MLIDKLSGELELALKTKSATKRVAVKKITKKTSSRTPVNKKTQSIAKKPVVKRSTAVAVVPQNGFSPAALEALIASRPFEPEWMKDRRRESFHVLLDTPFPARTDEAWRRTDIGPLRLNDVESVGPSVNGTSSVKSAPKSIKEVVRGTGTS
ncbi:MAG TPA: hypothetical protein VFK30_03245, partial [Anaerolineae bacterium]|nr:hypothetical protein [Anaerolineae bacterium]